LSTDILSTDILSTNILSTNILSINILSTNMQSFWENYLSGTNDWRCDLAAWCNSHPLHLSNKVSWVRIHARA
jgi:hypothetical protein